MMHDDRLLRDMLRVGADVAFFDDGPNWVAETNGADGKMARRTLADNIKAYFEREGASLAKAEDDDLFKANVHVKSYTRMEGGKPVQVMAYEANRLRGAQYVGKRRESKRDMWHYVYKDKEGEFPHYAPPENHPHSSIYRRDVQRARSYAEKHGMKPDPGMNHDPQGMFVIGDAAKNALIADRVKRGEIRKEKRSASGGKKDTLPEGATPETHPQWFSKDGQRLNRAYPTRPGIEVIFNEIGERDYVCQWRNPKTGKWEYCYTQATRDAKDDAKYHRVRLFAKRINSVREKVTEDFWHPGRDATVKNASDIKLCAAVALLVDHTYIRVGAEDVEVKKARGVKGEHHGLLTLRVGHVTFGTVDGKPAAILDFIGKSGVSNKRIVSEKPLIDYLKKMTVGKRGNEKIFHLEGEDRTTSAYDVVDQHFRSRYGCTPKDFRTYHGTRIAKEYLAKNSRKVKDEGDIKTIIQEAIVEAARHLGNEPATARKYYVDPFVITTWTENMMAKIRGGGDLKKSDDDDLGKDRLMPEAIPTYYVPLDGSGHKGEEAFRAFYDLSFETDQSKKTIYSDPTAYMDPEDPHWEPESLLRRQEEPEDLRHVVMVDDVADEKKKQEEPEKPQPKLMVNKQQDEGEK
jgi:DNA topoisomerase IB